MDLGPLGDVVADRAVAVRVVGIAATSSGEPWSAARAIAPTPTCTQRGAARQDVGSDVVSVSAPRSTFAFKPAQSTAFRPLSMLVIGLPPSRSTTIS